MNASVRREAHLRQVAARQRRQLHKGRSRNPRAVGYGTFQIVDPVIGLLYSQEGRDSAYGLSLDEVARALGEVE
ncbi:hypothetical protein HZU40_23620 [Mycolicibacterium fluoranthenivorans]|uniref:Uncharacterized protein n=1 Tax=Mycolicibacterium fluoranthenivorans TaxID=258505 RepID=A0A7G8PA19_9MYCO|nr:hypothetical protein [Mycolicibacterium fluoranthenivorans]QNJ91185.1 hypothetical protein HZU40_23620 [Mycolicibacterium fluoranthenivorans]